VKRGIVVGVAGVAVVVAACAGCSSNKSNTGAGASGSAPSAAGPQVTVDGKNQNVTGQVTCNSANGVTTIGIGDATAGVGAVVSNDNPPIVHSVGLGSVNGVTLGFSDAAPNQASNAGAAVNGKSYAIKGTASGVDMSNPQQPQPVTKSFEMDVTCP
jgi:ipoprotein LpqH